VETKKEEQIRVPFENLVKDNILKDWEILYTKKSFNKQAKVLKNWLLEFEKNVGSIHKIWALIQESPSCNGWKFWYILRNNETLLLDELRQEYVKQYLLIA
jgi:modification methylase